MGNPVQFQAHIYACPEDQRDQLAEALAGYLFGIDWEPHDTADDDKVQFESPYTEHHFTPGEAGSVANQLIAAAPGCSFVLWEDPLNEWLGTICCYTPDLGTFTGECTEQGDVVLGWSRISQLLTDLGEPLDQANDGKPLDRPWMVDLGAVGSHLGKAYGRPWIDDWKAS